MLLRVGYLPLMLVGFNAAGVALASAGATGWLLPLLLTAVAASFAVERVIPYQADWNRDRGDRGRDLLHALVNEVSALAAVATLPLMTAWVGAGHLWPGSWPFAVQVIAAILVMDAGITLAHRASHEWAWLWRFHAVHHSVKRFYGFNGLMKHPIHQAIELAAGSLPLVLLGIPIDVANAVAFCVAIQLLLQHSNADYSIGPLRTVLALNQTHRFHHLRWPVVGDVNFGLFTNLWDHLLGTFAWDPDRRFTSDDLGIAALPAYPTAYAAQLAAPFGSQARFEELIGSEGAHAPGLGAAQE